MFSVRFSKDKVTVELSFSYFVSPEVEREFNMNRELTETIGKTFEKLVGNLNKQIAQVGNASRKGKKQAADFQKNNLDITVALYDEYNKILSEKTPNDEAWREGFKVRINNRVYVVSVDLPCLKRLALPKILLANMPSVVVTDNEDADILETCKYSWYRSLNSTSTGPWELLNEGVNQRMIILGDDCVDRYIKLVCVPSDGKRDGVPVEQISSSCVQKFFELNELPMTTAHKMTSEKLSGKNLRIVSYNLLAKAYGDSTGAKIHFYPYCPETFVEFKYRRSMLMHEMTNYNADVLFLQECDAECFDIDIKNSLFLLGYSGLHKTKGTASLEGEAILYRKDRFKFVKSYDIKMTEKMQSYPLFKHLLSKNEELKSQIEERNTILQVMLVESLEHEGSYLLLANTHLYFHATADFIRLMQAAVSVKHLQAVVSELKKEGKKVQVVFGGDFNSGPNSYAVNYLLSGKIPLDLLQKEQKELIEDECEQFEHRFNFETSYKDFKYTNYLAKFNMILDYIFFERDSFRLTRVLPLPTHEQVTRYTALPSRLIPSDHLAIVYEFEWLLQNNNT